MSNVGDKRNQQYLNFLNPPVFGVERKSVTVYSHYELTIATFDELERRETVLLIWKLFL